MSDEMIFIKFCNRLSTWLQNLCWWINLPECLAKSLLLWSRQSKQSLNSENCSGTKFSKKTQPAIQRQLLRLLFYSLCSADDAPFFPYPLSPPSTQIFNISLILEICPDETWHTVEDENLWLQIYLYFPFWNCEGQFKHLARRVNLNLPKCFLAVNNYSSNNPSEYQLMSYFSIIFTGFRTK